MRQVPSTGGIGDSPGRYRTERNRRAGPLRNNNYSTVQRTVPRMVADNKQVTIFFPRAPSFYFFITLFFIKTILRNAPTMKNMFVGIHLVITATLCLALLLSLSDAKELKMDEEFMEISLDAIDLSYIISTPFPANNGRYDSFKVFGFEPDRTVLAQKDGRCYLAFRTTNYINPADVVQNFIPGTTKVCPRKGGDDCCIGNAGMVTVYDNSYRQEMEDAVDDCVKECKAKDCLVLTGHSQGGTASQIGSVILNDLNPLVVTFGNAPGVNDGCDQADTSRWVRYVNTRISYTGGMQYDLVAYPLPDPSVYLGHLGRTVLLSSDPTGVAALPLDSANAFSPPDLLSNFRTHRIQLGPLSTEKGYRERIDDLMAQESYPIRTTGYSKGYPCTQDIECDSGVCGGGIFLLVSSKCQ